jgi:hypothetical protein
MATWTQLVWQQAAVALLNGKQNLRTLHTVFCILTHYTSVIGKFIKNF